MVLYQKHIKSNPGYNSHTYIYMSIHAFSIDRTSRFGII